MKLKTVKTDGAGRLIRFAGLFFAITTMSSCVYEEHTDSFDLTENSVGVELLIRTRSAQGDGYEKGDVWENYIDINGGDYRIYFFTADRNDASAKNDGERNTLIAEFVPKDITSTGGADYTLYTLFGEVDDEIAKHADFKVVVLANWGHYPTVTAGETTIDALVEGDNTTFSAESFFGGVDSEHLIPFFGLREYSNVRWKKGWMTILTDDISLLRAVAKVEVVMAEDSEIDAFDSVSIVRYNDSGYCAPGGVYLRNDYDHDYVWSDDFTDRVHLVGGRNNGGFGTAPFNRQSGADTDRWSIYLPEYDNKSGGDPAYIFVTVDGAEHEIYFANYVGGVTSSKADYDILRNCLYRFYVTVTVEEKEVSIIVRAHVDKWEACFDNEYVFDRRRDRRRGFPLIGRECVIKIRR